MEDDGTTWELLSSSLTTYGSWEFEFGKISRPKLLNCPAGGHHHDHDHRGLWLLFFGPVDVTCSMRVVRYTVHIKGKLPL